MVTSGGLPRAGALSASLPGASCLPAVGSVFDRTCRQPAYYNHSPARAQGGDGRNWEAIARTWPELRFRSAASSLVRPYVARVSSICRLCGLASMYPASDWGCSAGIIDISAPLRHPRRCQQRASPQRLERERHAAVDRSPRRCVTPIGLKRAMLNKSSVCFDVGVALLATTAFAQAPQPPAASPRGDAPARSKAAHFRLEQGDNGIDVKCADDEPMRACRYHDAVPGQARDHSTEDDGIGTAAMTCGWATAQDPSLGQIARSVAHRGLVTCCEGWHHQLNPGALRRLEMNGPRRAGVRAAAGW
jgi:hypothetical protein